MSEIKRGDFGKDFDWGVSSSAYQTEGAYNVDGKGLSIWDVFTAKKGSVKANQHAFNATDFYHRYKQDLFLMHALSIQNFRFSLSWPRILPNGVGEKNQKGLDFYDRLIDECLDLGITPWITLYHWDLPQALQNKGGWENRDIINWIGEYAELVFKKYGDRVNNWMMLNEPAAFTGLGYFLGIHAPGLKGLKHFLPAMHHAVLAQASLGRLFRSMNSDVNIGTTFSFSPVDSVSDRDRDVKAAERVDALLNRLFIEPLLGKGYPAESLSFLNRLEKYIYPDDLSLLKFDFNFIGVQTYSREVVGHAWLTPLIHAKLISPRKRNVRQTAMRWEYYPKGIYRILKRLNNYPDMPELIVTETGIALKDQIEFGSIKDVDRSKFLKESLIALRKAQQEGVKVGGYFYWSFTDNFEWAEGYSPRFGLVYIDYSNQKRILKNSAYIFQKFLEDQISIHQI